MQAASRQCLARPASTLLPALARGLFALALLLAAPEARAQDPVPDTTSIPQDAVDPRLEALVEGDASGDPTVLLELLEDLRENPLNINTATVSELSQIPALDALLAAAVVRQRRPTGRSVRSPRSRPCRG